MKSAIESKDTLMRGILATLQRQDVFEMDVVIDTVDHRFLGYTLGCASC